MNRNYYIIVNSRGTPLDAFHSNAGWNIKEVFPCTWKSYMFFSYKRDAVEHLKHIINSCEAQRSRWGDWTDTALDYARTLRVVKEAA